MPITPNSSDEDNAAIAAAYLRFARVLRRGDDAELFSPNPDEAAYSGVDRAIREAPTDVVWRLILELLRQAPHDELVITAVGTLEPLLQRRGAEFVDRVEYEASADERFCWALGQVWLREDDMPAEALDRIVRASGGQIKPMAKRQPLKGRLFRRLGELRKRD